MTEREYKIIGFNFLAQKILQGSHKILSLEDRFKLRDLIEQARVELE